MVRNLVLFLKEIGTPGFWKDIAGTFRAMALSPKKFYEGAGRGDWAAQAYRLGLLGGLISALLDAGNHLDFLKAHFHLSGILLLPAALVGGVGVWLVYSLVLFYVVPVLFDFSAKLIVRQTCLSKIRPILFTAVPAGILAYIPKAGFGISFFLGFFLVLTAFQVYFILEIKKTAWIVLIGTLLSGTVIFLLEAGLENPLWLAAAAGIAAVILGLHRLLPADSLKACDDIANPEAIDFFFKSLQGLSPKYKAEKAADKFKNSLKNSLALLEPDADQFYPLLLNGLMEDGLLENSDKNGWELPLACREEGVKKFWKQVWPQLSKKFKFIHTVEQAIEDVVTTDFPLTDQARAEFGIAKDGK